MSSISAVSPSFRRRKPRIRRVLNPPLQPKPKTGNGVNMTILESAQRQAVLAIAESWVGTPFHHQGRVKGRQGGVDCAMLLLEVFLSAGVIDAKLAKRRFSYSHGAIVLLWPCIIHAAAAPIGACVLDNAYSSALNLNQYPVKFFTAWP